MRMHKSWRVVSGIALICLVIGVLGVGVAFFTGSSPVVIRAHGGLAEYLDRLRMNWDILTQMIRSWF